MILMAKSKKDILLNTSMKLFKEYGVSAVGVDQISEEAKVAKMTLYKYFPSKNDLIKACLIEEDLLVRKSIHDRIQKFDYLENLNKIYLWHVEQIFSKDKYGYLFLKVMNEIQNDSLISRLIYQHRVWKGELIRQQLYGLNIRQPEAFSMILLNLMENILFSSDKGVDHIAMWTLLESFLKSNAH